MICLLKPDKYLEEILRQEGVAYSTVPTPDSRIFIDSSTNYLILSTSKEQISTFNGRRKKINFLIPDDSNFFSNVHLVDIGAVCWVPVNANIGRSDRGDATVFYSQDPDTGEQIFILPLKTSQILTHRGMRAKQFFCQSARLPYETVAVVDRGGIRRLIAASLRTLFFKLGLPYIHLAYVPSGGCSILGFRVDTDFGTFSVVKRAAQLADKLGMHWTWFIHTEPVAGEIKEFKKILFYHDLQLHCHKHLVYPDVKRNIINFSNGKKLLNINDIYPIGAAAPYGEWNYNLYRAFSEIGLAYSSEFGYAYDDLPSRPIVDGIPGNTVQIPVHPISLGRLVWARADRKAIFAYYRKVIDLQAARREPCFLYDHPRWIIDYQDVLGDVLKYGMERCGNWSTLTDYYRWWQLREQISYNVKLNGNDLDLQVETEGNRVSLAVEFCDKIAFMPLCSGRINLTLLEWQPTLPPIIFDPKELSTRKSNWKLLVYEKIRQCQKLLQMRGRY